MILEVKVNPDHIVHPDIGNNLQLPEDARFGFVVKKINQSLHSYKWLYMEEGKAKTDLRLWVKAHVVRIVNPITLKFPDGTTRPIELNDIFTDTIQSDDFETMINCVADKIGEIREVELDTKK